MKNLKIHIALIFLLTTLMASSQQFPHLTQYLINPYALTPTLAGQTGYSEIFLGYRNDWTRIDGSPRTFSASGSGNIYQQKMWLGGEAMMDKTDILSGDSVSNTPLNLLAICRTEGYIGLCCLCPAQL